LGKWAARRALSQSWCTTNFFAGVHVFVSNGLEVGGPGVPPFSESNDLVSGLVLFLSLVGEEGSDKSDPLNVQCLRIKPKIVDNFLPPGMERGFWFSVVGSWFQEFDHSQAFSSVRCQCWGGRLPWDMSGKGSNQFFNELGQFIREF
jgi:hypothetical protein